MAIVAKKEIDFGDYIVVIAVFEALRVGNARNIIGRRVIGVVSKWEKVPCFIPCVKSAV
jgi:hypothetical protein